MARKSSSSSIVIQVILVLFAILMVVPFAWMALTALKTGTESTQVDPFVIFPSHWNMDSFRTVIKNMNFLVLYKNTLLMILFRILCAVVFSSMAGYAFGRLTFPGSKFAFSLVLFQMMIPSQIFIIPQYQMISKMHMANTIFALVFPRLVSAFGTFLMRQAYMILPRDLEDAARIDGLNIGKIFLFVMAPLTKSALVALSIFTAIFAYKDLLWPMIVNTKKDSLVLASALAKMQGQYASHYPELMAASLIACVPMIIIYLFFQRQFMEGIATSGEKL